MIMAGGSGTRLWPMSRAGQPKQLIPLINGKSLIELAFDRLTGLIEPGQRYICAGQTHEPAIREIFPQLPGGSYLAEPMGRDTLNAVGFAAAVIAKTDPNAIMAVLTADHLIEPVDQFVQMLEQGFELAESQPQTLVTFGVTPTHAATGYGYLQLEDSITGDARQVSQFKEKPDAATAGAYLKAGADQYLWNSGMFVWPVKTLLACLERYVPENFAGLMQIAEAWGTDDQQKVLEAVYPTLEKISVDYAIMERAAADDAVTVAAIPMQITWLDIGSWPAFAQTLEQDEQANTHTAGRHLLMDSKRNQIVSQDPEHLIAMIGCDDLVVVHTEKSTLICHRDQAEKIKKLQAQVAEQFPRHA